MLEELTLTLPRLKFYEKTVSMDTEMETALLTVYQEVICFYARAIHFFRSNKHCKDPMSFEPPIYCAETNYAKHFCYAAHGLACVLTSNEPSSESSVYPAISRARLS